DADILSLARGPGGSCPASGADARGRISSLVFIQRSCDPRDLHSFPTRRSSDLATRICPSQPAPAPMPIVGMESAEVICCASSTGDRKSTRLNSSHVAISYAVCCVEKKKNSEEFESRAGCKHYTHDSDPCDQVEH